jgi:heme-degrading monooxygenase HmoA
MLACIIEFGICEGREKQRDALVAALMKAVVDVDGFVSKETYACRDVPGKLITLSYWRDAESLQRWVRHPTHVHTVTIGKRDVFTYYNIEVSEVTRTINWQRPPDDSATIV